LHQGSRRHRTELPGAHSRERLRYRQAPNDDDDDDDIDTAFVLCIITFLFITYDQTCDSSHAVFELTSTGQTIAPDADHILHYTRGFDLGPTYELLTAESCTEESPRSRSIPVEDVSLCVRERNYQ